LPSKYINDEIKDSKQLSGKKREILFDVIIKNAIDYQITFIDPSEVDRLNPKQATIQGMQKGVAELKIKPDILLVDSEKLNTGIESRSIVKGDQKSISIAAASILAKVSRDRYMIKLSEQYPQYHFEKHKGYGTIDHLKALKKYGPIKNFHRYSYRPVKVMLANTNKIELQ
jgi:ribonuclease HII